MGFLGKLGMAGKLNPQNPVLAGGWTIAYRPGDIGIRVDAEVYHIAIRGPAPSKFQVFIDDVFYDNVARGDINSWDPNNGMFVRPGDTIFFHYNTLATPAPFATCYFRETSPI